jgi:hypothetical protein
VQPFFNPHPLSLVVCWLLSAILCLLLGICCLLSVAC